MCVFTDHLQLSAIAEDAYNIFENSMVYYYGADDVDFGRQSNDIGQRKGKPYGCCHIPCWFHYLGTRNRKENSTIGSISTTMFTVCIQIIIYVIQTALHTGDRSLLRIHRLDSEVNSNWSHFAPMKLYGCLFATRSCILPFSIVMCKTWIGWFQQEQEIQAHATI